MEKYFDRKEFIEKTEYAIKRRKSDYNEYVLKYCMNENILLNHPELPQEETERYINENVKITLRIAAIEREIPELETILTTEEVTYLGELAYMQVDGKTPTWQLRDILELVYGVRPYDMRHMENEELVAMINEKRAAVA